MALDITDVFLEFRVLEGGLVIAKVTAEFAENCILTGIPEWNLVDGLGNNHKAYNASPHIKPTDTLVDYATALFHCEPHFDDYSLEVAPADTHVTNVALEPIPAGDYPITRR